MPTYEYHCAKCGTFEAFHGINDQLTHCPTCQGEIRRLISRNSNIIFKGSGFYSTDSRSGADQQKAASESSGSGSAGSTSNTDSKAS